MIDIPARRARLQKATKYQNGRQWHLIDGVKTVPEDIIACCDLPFFVSLANEEAETLDEIENLRKCVEEFKGMDMPTADQNDRAFVPPPIIHVIEQYNNSWRSLRDSIIERYGV